MHAGHHVDNLVAAIDVTAQASDCCGADCECPTAACFSALALVTGTRTASIPRATELYLPLTLAAVTRLHSSLFRPPISA